MSLELDEHRQYLADQRRLDALARATAAVVRAGDVVVDLGCGTGILGLLACRAGARRVYAIDESGMAEIAEALAAANGYADRITILRGGSLHVSIPERADVVIADQIGGFGFEAGIVEYFADAKRRFLKSNGRLMPRSLSLWIAPVEHNGVYEDATFWSGHPAGFDMSPAQMIASNSGYPRRVEGPDLLGSGCHAITLALGDEHPWFSFSVDAPIHRRGVMHGVAGWFMADLADGIVMTNAPGDASRIQRRNAIFPIARPIAVTPGDTVRVRMQVRPADLMVKWIVSCGDQQFEHSTFNGMLLSPDVIRRTRPQFIPCLTVRGRARKLVLDLADGRASLADIERSLFDAYPQLFTDPADAGRFVAEVVTRYAE